MANLRSVKPKTVRVVTPLAYVSEFGLDEWAVLSSSRPLVGAKIVLFFIENKWVHKGWLMPHEY